MATAGKEEARSGTDDALAARHLESAVNPPHLMEEHLAITGGKASASQQCQLNAYSL
jgi:hypothetical protein